jgi:hypothetical protein
MKTKVQESFEQWRKENVKTIFVKEEDYLRFAEHFANRINHGSNYVTRSVYQKISEQNKKLINDIRILVSDKFKTMQGACVQSDLKKSWQKKFEKEKDFYDSLIEVLNKNQQPELGFEKLGVEDKKFLVYQNPNEQRAPHTKDIVDRLLEATGAIKAHNNRILDEQGWDCNCKIPDYSENTDTGVNFCATCYGKIN